MYIILIFLAIIIYGWYKKRNKPQNSAPINFSNLNGENIFCYNNSKRSQTYIEQEILPLLSENIKIIYLNGKVPESSYSELDTRLLLLQLRNYDRFPHLIKIREGTALDISINNEMFNCINQNKSPDSVIKITNSFFELG